MAFVTTLDARSRTAERGSLGIKSRHRAGELSLAGVRLLAFLQVEEAQEIVGVNGKSPVEDLPLGEIELWASATSLTPRVNLEWCCYLEGLAAKVSPSEWLDRRLLAVATVATGRAVIATPRRWPVIAASRRTAIDALCSAALDACEAWIADPSEERIMDWNMAAEHNNLPSWVPRSWSWELALGVAAGILGHAETRKIVAAAITKAILK